MLYLILFLYLFSSKPNSTINCDPELKITLETVRKLNDAEKLIEQVLADGPIAIKSAPDFPFEAYWDPSTRTVGVTPAGDKIHSILFELHNASAQNFFEYYDALAREKKISKDDYVRAIEQIEYQNTFKTAALIDEGIRRGIFPKESQVYCYSATFEEHLSDQMAAGHSAWIADMYDWLAS